MVDMLGTQSGLNSPNVNAQQQNQNIQAMIQALGQQNQNQQQALQQAQQPTQAPPSYSPIGTLGQMAPAALKAYQNYQQNQDVNPDYLAATGGQLQPNPFSSNNVPDSVWGGPIME